MNDGLGKSSATLGQIARVVGGELCGDPAIVVRDVTHDSRMVSDQSLFVAIRGQQADGNAFVSEAIARGACAVVSELASPAGCEVAWVRVKDARVALAKAAATVHHHPSRELKLVGITGTNGKTTTTYLVASIAEASGDPCAMLSTVEYRIGAERIAAERTTLEASDTQRYLRRAVERGCRAAVMECSSIAIELHRCDELEFAAAVFTNFSRDHLDFHGTMESYWSAKRRLFEGLSGGPPRVAVVNLDDERGAELARDLARAGTPIITYAVERNADVTARDVTISLDGMSFSLETPAGRTTVSSPLVGQPHVYNTLAAVGAGLALGYELNSIRRGIEKCAGAPGRFERVAHAEDFAVIVDYAHTEDALANVLRTARALARGRVIVVFGCGGDRDRTKRAPMGRTAAELADLVVVTSDNPRTEDPEAIIAEIEVGLRQVSELYEKIPDRREAILRAIALAKPGDVVIIAGKGHEDYQIIGRQKVHFDDREVAREALKQRSGKG
ncbi:MAG: UDP-N-acetylmuramoyl-L-alanyl-D-glutamate--2,6-diaminopimelate ligase [Pyrinomonas sp.]|uniref:UDP-N-acetylmuramoyl-L-alanyl-D-glutamate--2, 6-diaminopimelate ligase n=1 Tax=Pyrinomonas sp. TaxID=2080306 RepID=UPI00332C0402